MLKANDKLHGFTVRYVQPLEEIKATLYRMEYEKNGADLVWLKRDDDNKTFSIAFKTLPQDDTGVFHIIEHSVLCGSDKYPTKEPFVELLKSSLQTFLNAITFADKTMYPVASRNDKDFLNLIDVYMDAVLHPLSISSPLAFRQEGWHYELDSPEGELSCNGVVYNEMKGAFASADSELQYRLQRALTPDNCYGYESGGHPDHITELTYENYKASHARFYHPSNSRIFLDGDVDIDTVLGKLDGFLCEYERIDPDADIPMHKPVTPEDGTFYYEISPEDQAPNRAIYAAGWIYGDYSQTDKKIGAQILRQVLCGSNEAPLKKALLEAGLCEDVELYGNDVAQCMTGLVVRNAKPEDKDKIWQTVESVLREQAENGLDREQLSATLNHFEFVTREKDFGRMPRGLVYAITCLDSWLYGGDPAQELCYDATFAKLREGLDKGYFEALLREMMLDNPHTARICLLPSTTLGEEKRAAERERLAAVKAQWDEAMCEEVIAQFKELRVHQEQPDSPEAVASLPLLSLSDISDDITQVPQTVGEAMGCTTLHQPIETGGITYFELYFDLSDLSLEELSNASLLAALLGNIATKNYSPIELRSQISGNLGRFDVSASVLSAGAADKCKPFVTVGVSALHSRVGEALRLMDEILLGSSFADERFIGSILRQRKMMQEQNVIMGGNAVAAMRVAASFSARGAAQEAIAGLTALRNLQKLDKAFADDGAAVCAGLKALCDRIFIRDRLTVSISGDADEALFASAAGIFPAAPQLKGEAAEYELYDRQREGFTIPAEIGFAVKAANLNSVSSKYSGAFRVAAQFLTYDYLWNAVRVKGGAYGTGLNVRAEGDVAFTSYRDPSAANSLNVYDGAGDALRALCGSGSPIDKYIISTIAETEPVTTPRMDGNLAAVRYLTGQTAQKRRKTRREILGTTTEQLLEIADVLDKLCSEAGVCVIGGKTVLDACGLDKIEAVQQ